MNIILGATGQIGSMLVNNLLKKDQPVRAVIRNSSKVQELTNEVAEVVIADYSDAEALKRAFQGGSSVFLLTPENPECKNCLKEIQMIINNYKRLSYLPELLKLFVYLLWGHSTNLELGI